MPFAPSLDAFRFYNDDGSESASTTAAAQNANIGITDGAGNKNYLLRLGIQENANINGSNLVWQLQARLNAGTWFNVTTSSSYVRAFDSSNLTDGSTTTQRLAGLSGGFSPGKVSEIGSLTANLSKAKNTELLYAIQTVDADLAGGDAVDFRVLYDGSALAGGYNVTPSITNEASGPSGSVVKTLSSLTLSAAGSVSNPVVPAPANFGFKVAAGSSGPQSLDSGYDLRRFKPGQTWYFGLFWTAARISGSSHDTITAKLRYWDSSDVELTATTSTIDVNGTTGWAFVEAAHVAPTNAKRARVSFAFTCGGATFGHDINGTAIRIAKTQYAATYGADLLANVLNKSLANLDSTASTKLTGIDDGATYGADLANNVTNVAPNYLPPIMGAGLRYKVTGAPGYTGATTTQATVTHSGTLIVGSRTYTYSSSSIVVTGSGTQTFYIYVQTNPFSNGTHTLLATTNANTPYQNDNNVYIGSVTITFTTGGSGTGDTGGGGGTTGCPWAEAFVLTRRGAVRAAEVVAGDEVRSLNEDETFGWATVESNEPHFGAAYTVRGAGGAATASESTPVLLRTGALIPLAAMKDGDELPFGGGEAARWEPCTKTDAGMLDTSKIRCGQAIFAVSDDPDGPWIFLHNPKP